MDIQREEIADILFTAAIVSAGVLFGTPVMQGVVANIGVTWAADLTRQGWQHVCRQLLSDSGILNHDLQQALVRAFEQAIAHMEEEWWATPRGAQMRREEPEAARLAAQPFKLLREDSVRFFTLDRLNRAAGNDGVRELLYGDQFIARQTLANKLSDYLHGHDPQLIDFIESHFARELAFWFGEQLKADSPESNRAWRAFQRWMLEGLQSGLEEIRSDQQEILHVVSQLQHWHESLEARPSEAREPTGQEELERALVDVRGQLVEAIVKESTQTRQVIEESLDDIKEIFSRAEIPSPPEPSQPPEVVEFVGREAELTYFAERLAKSGLAVITGMPGVGKTALAAELVRRVGYPPRIFWHSFQQGEGVDVVIWKLAGFLARRGQDEVWRMLFSAQQAGDRSPPPEILFDYLLQMIRGQGYLLCLDDFQFVDDDPLLAGLVERLRRAIQSGHQSLLITSLQVPDFVQISEFEVLHGLSASDTRRLLSMCGLSLPDALVDELHATTEGNAQLLMLAIDTLQRSEDPVTVIGRLSATDNVERYLMSKVDDGLTGDERAVMTGVAVLLGYPGSRDAIEAILDRDSVHRTLHDLSSRHLLTVRKDEMRREYGQHSVIQEFYYDLLGRRARRTMHRRAGEYYSSEGRNVLEAARHYERAGEYERAVQLIAGDAWKLINQGRASILLRLLGRIADQRSFLSSDQWVALCQARGDAHRMRGEYQSALEVYEAALVETKSERTQSDLLRRTGTTYELLGEFEQAREYFTEALRIRKRLQDKAGIAEIYHALGWAHYRLGELTQAHQHFILAREMGEELNARLLLAKTDLGLGVVDLHAEAADEAQTRFEESRRVFRAVGERRREAMAVGNLGHIYLHFEDLERAQAYFMEAAELQQQTGDADGLGVTYNNLGYVNYKLGKYGEAIQNYENSAQIARDSGHDRRLSLAHSGLADAHLAVEDYKHALQHALKAQQIAEDIGAGMELGISYRILGSVRWALEEPLQAEACFEASLPLLEAAGQKEELAKARHGLDLARAASSPDLK